MLGNSSSSSLNLRSDVLHSRFSFRMHRGHLSIRCLSKKVHRTSKRELWVLLSQVCGNERLFTSQNCLSRNYYMIQNMSRYIHQLPKNCLKLVTQTSYGERDHMSWTSVQPLPIPTEVQHNVHTNRLYKCVPWWHVPYNERSLKLSIVFRDVAQNKTIRTVLGCWKVWSVTTTNIHNDGRSRRNEAPWLNWIYKPPQRCHHCIWERVAGIVA